VNVPLEGSILNADAESAGVGFDDQTSRTSILKQLERQSLENHPNQAAHPVKRLGQRDKVSLAWLSAIPTPTSYIPSPEYTQAMAWFLFLPSPACRPYVGPFINGIPLDPQGQFLMCARLPFDSWRTIRAQSLCLLSRLSHLQPGAHEAPSHHKAKRRTAQSRPKGTFSGTCSL